MLWLRFWFYIIHGFTNEKVRFQLQNAVWTFFDCHLSFFIGKRRYDCCARLYIAQMVLKNASISSFFNGQRWTKCAMNILRSYLNWWHNWQLKNRRRSHTLKGSYSMGDGRIFLKTRSDSSFNKDQMSLISTGSISLDGTFNTTSADCWHQVWREFHWGLKERGARQPAALSSSARSRSSGLIRRRRNGSSYSSSSSCSNSFYSNSW